MRIVIYSNRNNKYYVTISHYKDSTLYHLFISDIYGSIVKKGEYITLQAAKQAIKRFYKREGILEWIEL